LTPTLADPGDQLRGEKRKQDDSIITPPQKVLRLELDDNSIENDWDLPADLLEYFNKYRAAKIPDKEDER
jgi:hypothetical protein